MIVNLLKIIFFYFVYRFVKVLLKGYFSKKIKQATDHINEQMKAGQYPHHQDYRHEDRTSNSSSRPKTFDAEYKVLKD